jgi:murein DD-endopeptidase MepM/ murein hydrolase activator NlpD
MHPREQYEGFYDLTRTPDSTNETGAPVAERQLSRRELRKQQIIEDAKAGIIQPQSIFDLEYIPRPRKPSIPEPELVSDTDEVMDAQLKPDVVQAPEVQEEVQPEPEPEPEPASQLAPAPVPEPRTEPASQPQPARVTLAPAVKSKRATISDTTLLFQRIPEPAAVAASAGATSTAATEQNDAPSKPHRNKFAMIAAVVAVFGLVLTLSLPAVDSPAESSSAATQLQGLTADNTAQSAIDIESFESVDELEVAAEAATLRANTFTNDPTAAVQYPFDVGVPITDGFGPRDFPVSGFHDAQDFAAGYGAAVRSIAAGTVIESGATTDGCGFGLKIKHRIDKHDVMSRYCHLAADPIVKVGDKVTPGQFVALVGATGMAFGAHLHFVIQVDGAAIDPMPFLAKYNKPKPAAAKTSASN